MATISCLTVPPVSWLSWSDNAHDSTPDDRVFVFRCAIDSPFASLTPHLLTPTERQRANRFHQAIDRQRFVLGRSLLRQITAHFSSELPEQIEIKLGPTGKPEWVNNLSWHVNLAHAGNWVLLALANVAVGVDVEQIRSDFDYQSLLHSTFSKDEHLFIKSHHNPRSAFYDLWTRKEAILKAVGTGLNDHLPQLSVLAGTRTIADDLLGSTGHWTITSVSVDEAHLAAVAWAGSLPAAFSPVTCYTV